MEAEWTAVILAGGRAERLGMAKSDALIANTPLLERILAELQVPVVVAGEAPAGIRSVREAPPFGGPAAGLAAALNAVETELVAVLAVDMPFAVPLLSPLVAELAESDADAVLAFDWRPQPLCAAYRAERVRSAIARLGGGGGLSMLAIVDQLEVRCRPADGDLLLDIDTPADLEAARERLRLDGER